MANIRTNGADGTQGRGAPPQTFTPNEMRTAMTIQAESNTEQVQIETGASVEAALKQLSDVGNIVAKGEEAKALRKELIQQLDKAGVSPTKIAAAAQVTRKMIYHNRENG